MASTWILDAETSINAIIKKRSLDVLISDYQEISFTQDSVTDGDPIFPTVYIHFLPAVEEGSDLEGVSVNAILSTAQVEITVNKSQGLEGARIVTSVVLDEFKRIGFKITSSPEFVGNTVDTKRMVFRVQRMIGVNDKF